MERFARKSSITGKGINEFFCIESHDFYCETEEEFLAYVKPILNEIELDFSECEYADSLDDIKTDEDLKRILYDSGFYYWSQILDDDIEDNDEYYDADGNSYVNGVLQIEDNNSEK